MGERLEDISSWNISQGHFAICSCQLSVSGENESYETESSTTSRYVKKMIRWAKENIKEEEEYGEVEGGGGGWRRTMKD